MRPRSAGVKLYNELVDSGFEVTLSRRRSRGRAEVTLRVRAGELGAKKIELLSDKVDQYGARMLFDHRGVFVVWFE